MTVFASGVQVIDNSLSPTPLDWQELIPATPTITPENWFTTGLIQLQLQVFFSATFNPAVGRSNTERFTNPTQSQIGYWQANSNGFTTLDGRIKYEKQLQTFKSPLIQIGRTLNDGLSIYKLTENTAVGHSTNIAEFGVCGTVRGLTPPPPVPAAMTLSGTIGKGAMCMSLNMGEMEFVRADPYLGGPGLFVPNITDWGFPDSLSGLVYGGYILEVGWVLESYDYESSAVSIAIPRIVKGSFPPIYQPYTCSTVGVQTPAPGTCLPGQVPTLVFGGLGTYSNGIQNYGYTISCVGGLVP